MASVPLFVKKHFQPPPGAISAILRASAACGSVGEHGGNMLQLIHLRVNRRVHPVIAVADAHRQDAAEEIQILVAVRIPDELVLGPRDHQRLADSSGTPRETGTPDPAR